MANPNKSSRDPITGSGPSTGSPKDASRDRVKSINGGTPNFSKTPGGKSGWPVPDSPYGK